MTFDIVFRNASVYDGSGRDAYRADVGVSGSLIRAVSRGARLDGAVVLDLAGKALAPGFIDFHSHSEWIAPSPGGAAILRPLALQGVTTIVGGNCGFSPFPVSGESKELVLSNSKFLTDDSFEFAWDTAGDYFEFIERRGFPLNLASLTGHGALRALVSGNRPSALDDGELDRLLGALRDSMAQGALGASFGIAYVPGIFSDDREIEAIFRTVAEAGGMITVHGRTYSWTSPFYAADPSSEAHNVRDAKFFIGMAARTGARLNLSHVLLKGKHTWKTLDSVVDAIDKAIASGVDLSFGVIPYHWGNTLVTTLLPRWFLADFDKNLADRDAISKLSLELSKTEAEIGREFSDLHLLWGASSALDRFEGMSVDRIAEEMSMSPLETCLEIVKLSHGKAKILTASYSGNEGVEENPLDRLLAHPASICEIDTIVTDTKGPHNPATFGAIPKLLGRYARQRGVLSLPAAVRKVTGLPADRARLGEIGYIREGFRADLVVFDPETIIDANTIREPDKACVGVEAVYVGGTRIVPSGAGVQGTLNEGAVCGKVFRKASR